MRYLYTSLYHKGNLLSVLLVSVLLNIAKPVLAADSDLDGVPDTQDKCPNTALINNVAPDFKYRYAIIDERLKEERKAWPVDKDGCEFDSDHDGVIDSQNYCPEDSNEAIAMGVAKNGCPKHSDFDGTPDYRDNCPGTPRGVATDRFGCPK